MNPPGEDAAVAARLGNIEQSLRDLWKGKASTELGARLDGDVRALEETRATKAEVRAAIDATERLAAKVDRLIFVIILAAVTLAGSAITFALTASRIAGGGG